MLAYPGEELGAKHGGQGPAIEQVLSGLGVPVMARQPTARDQLILFESAYQNKKRKIPREIFLERMDKLIPWKQLENNEPNK